MKNTSKTFAQANQQIRAKLGLAQTRAFTLIELLVVIAIIGLLTGIVMTNLVGSKAKARDAKRVADLGQIQLALELYYDRCKEYPSNSPLNLNDSNGCPVTNPQINLGTFLPKIPTPPAPTTEYEYGAYSHNGTNNAYALRVVLESSNPALLDDTDVAPSSWPNSGNDIGDACLDTGATLYQYCLISN